MRANDTRTHWATKPPGGGFGWVKACDGTPTLNDGGYGSGTRDSVRRLNCKPCRASAAFRRDLGLDPRPAPVRP